MTAVDAFAGPRVELARYLTSDGERVIYGVCVAGVVVVSDWPADGPGRAFVIERGLTCERELYALVCERAPWRVKCSVVTNETVAAVGARADGSPSAMDTGSSHDGALWIRVLWRRGVGARRVDLRSLQRPTRAHAADLRAFHGRAVR